MFVVKLWVTMWSLLMSMTPEEVEAMTMAVIVVTSLVMLQIAMMLMATDPTPYPLSEVLSYLLSVTKSV